MPGPGREIQIRLYRDALSTPWGFRLHGGKDLRTPLTVQKVAVGSPVYGELQRDDVILEIQNCNATQMTHKQAQDLIRNAGGSLLVRVQRSFRTDAGQTGGPSYDNAGLPKGFMLGRVKNTLDTMLFEPSSGYGSNNHSDYGDVYSPASSHTSDNSGRYPTWTRPVSRPQPSGLMEPGWTPEALRQPRRRVAPGSASTLAPRQHQQYPTAGGTPPRGHNDARAVVSDQPPAWYGSLRPSVDARGSDRRVGGLHRSASPELYRYSGPSSTNAVTAVPFEPSTGNAVAQNLQYNTPMGLYSKANVQEAYTGQTTGGSVRPVPFGAPESEVSRMVHDDDIRTHGRPGTAGQRHQQPGSFDSPVVVQSPSMRVLESRFVAPELGTSDF